MVSGAKAMMGGLAAKATLSSPVERMGSKAGISKRTEKAKRAKMHSMAKMHGMAKEKRTSGSWEEKGSDSVFPKAKVSSARGKSLNLTHDREKWTFSFNA